MDRTGGAVVEVDTASAHQKRSIEAFHLEWREITVAGRPARYGVAGDGPAVLFLHGWGLDHRAYKRALRRLVESGVRVLAPALPGFGGTANLPAAQCSMAGFADWLVGFLDAIGVEDSIVAMGHSFGGGVAIALAHDHPERVGGLVLINSIGASGWTSPSSAVRWLARRPPWDWGLHLPRDLQPLDQARRVLPVIWQEALRNLTRDPRAFWRVAVVAGRADLTEELEELKRRRLPVVVLWGSRDRIITRSAFEQMCRALGRPDTVTVEGTHAWLIADPERFGEVMTNVVGIAELARSLGPERPRRAPSTSTRTRVGAAAGNQRTSRPRAGPRTGVA